MSVASRVKTSAIALSFFALCNFAAWAQFTTNPPPIQPDGITIAIQNGKLTAIGGAVYSPGYKVANWYLPYGYAPVTGIPAATGGGVMVCTLGSVSQPITIDTLGTASITTDNTKRVQLAVYSNGSWGRPWTLLASTGDITMGAAAASLSGAALGTVPQGPAWFCLNTESATAVFRSQTAITQVVGPALIGSTSLSMVVGAASTAGISISQTYGTWPASFNSSAAWTEVTTNIVPWIAFKISATL
jgi:hypothetical protein